MGTFLKRLAGSRRARLEIAMAVGLVLALWLAGCEAEYSQPGEQALIVGEYEVRFALLEAWQRLTGRDEKEPAPKVLTAVPDSSEAA